MSTEPTDPTDPTDPAEGSQDTVPADPVLPETSRVEPEGSEHIGEMVIDPDSALTEEVAVPSVEPDLSALGPIVSDLGVAEGDGFTIPSEDQGRRISMGRLFGLSLMLGTVLSVFLGLPICGDFGRFLLPPVMGGILIAVLASRWEGPAALNPTHVGVAGATVGVMLGTAVSIGIGFSLWTMRGELGPQLQEAAQGQMSATQIMILGAACMLPFMQCLYAALGLMSARWMLSRLLPRSDA